ncbi:MAG: hypothetical protein H7246_16880 [Phycisphaerae bacterium]|nr:hypothetical protein [Saprospiraceae bacterium]
MLLKDISLKAKLLGSILLTLVFSLQLSAQQELMLHSMPDLWHSASTNPAFFPENKTIAIGLPGIGLDAAHSGDISYNDIFVKSGDHRVIDFSNALSKLEPSNTLHFDQRIETMSLGFRIPGKMWLQVGHANRFSGSIIYPKTLPALIWDGNAQYIGQTVDIAPQTDVINWNEWSVGLAKGFGKLRLGLRVKYLTGTSALLTDDAHHSATVTTSDDIYQLSLATDYAFHASSIISAIDTSGLGFDFTVGKLKGKAFSKNTGVAFDLGAQYKVNEHITVDFALLDLGGKIKWKEKANYFISQGEYQYDGVTLPGADIINGSDSLDFSTKLDTLNDIFNFQKTAQTFETTLPLRAYAGGNFELSKRWSFGLGAYIQKRADEKATVAVGASARWALLKWLSLGAMYSVNERSAANFGFHLALKPGPVQLYFASDNLLNAFSVKSNPAVNLRTGLSLIF